MSNPRNTYPSREDRNPEFHPLFRLSVLGSVSREQRAAIVHALNDQLRQMGFPPAPDLECRDDGTVGILEVSGDAGANLTKPIVWEALRAVVSRLGDPSLVLPPFSGANKYVYDREAMDGLVAEGDELLASQIGTLRSRLSGLLESQEFRNAVQEYRRIEVRRGTGAVSFTINGMRATLAGDGTLIVHIDRNQRYVVSPADSSSGLRIDLPASIAEGVRYHYDSHKTYLRKRSTAPRGTTLTGIPSEIPDGAIEHPSGEASA